MTDILPNHPQRVSGRQRDNGAPREAFTRAQKHSRWVRLLKIVLPALALIMTAGIVGYSWILTPSSVSVDVAQTSYSGGKLVMANPTLNGFTKDKLSYTMTALRATQDLAQTTVFQLDGIKAKLPIDAGTWAMIDAPEGTYDREKNTIDFTGAVKLTTTDGKSADLEKVFVDIGSGELKTSDPVQITMNGADIAADSMTVLENGKVLIFEKRVRMKITPDRLETSGETTGDANDG